MDRVAHYSASVTADLVVFERVLHLAVTLLPIGGDLDCEVGGALCVPVWASESIQLVFVVPLALRFVGNISHNRGLILAVLTQHGAARDALFGH